MLSILAKESFYSSVLIRDIPKLNWQGKEEYLANHVESYIPPFPGVAVPCASQLPLGGDHR